jgi:hydroxypyruvate isomerase
VTHPKPSLRSAWEPRVGRRDFLAASLGAAAVAGLPLQDSKPAPAGAAPFRLDYAPHFGQFKAHAGDDPIAQLEFMAAEGFRSVEDNGMKGRPPEVQEKIGKALQRLGMRMGIFVCHADFGKVTFGSSDAAARDRILADMKESVDCAKRCGAKWMTLVLGRFDQGVEPGYQTANAIDNLRRCCELLEPHGLVMVMEGLNPWRDHPGMLLTKMPHAFEICRAVNSPSCKILFDFYHQQISEGNLLPNFERCLPEVAYIQLGDTPGRCEPGTGEINYKNVFKRVHELGYKGILGAEHGASKPGKPGERAVIDAYRAADSF